MREFSYLKNYYQKDGRGFDEENHYDIIGTVRQFLFSILCKVKA